MNLSRAFVCLSVVSSALGLQAYIPLLSAAPADSGLIGYYQFSGNANDSSGHLHHGMASGLSYGTDRFGNASSAGMFAGDANSHVVVNTTAFNLVQPFTVSVWVNFASGQGTQGPRIFSTAGYELTTDLNAGARFVNMNIAPGLAEGLTVKSGIAAPAGVWNQIVGVWSGQDMSLYLNGSLSASSATTLVPSYSRNWNPTIGANAGDLGKDMFAGGIDDLRIYNQALSSSEIQQLYLTEVPEPGFASLAMAGLGVLCFRRKH